MKYAIIAFVLFQGLVLNAQQPDPQLSKQEEKAFVNRQYDVYGSTYTDPNDSNRWICDVHRTMGRKDNPNMPACPVCLGKFESVSNQTISSQRRVHMSEKRVFQRSQMIERRVQVQPQVQVVQVPVPVYVEPVVIEKVVKVPVYRDRVIYREKRTVVHKERRHKEGSCCRPSVKVKVNVSVH
ncbi:MAG: hypothetical protein WCW87_00730 [Candidatus Paceibacterota bacterium]